MRESGRSSGGMTLVAFLQGQNCSNYPGSWRHAATEPGYLTAVYYQRIAQTLEAAKFQLAFFDDRLAMPDRYGDDPGAALEHGVRVVKLDPAPLLMAMGLATRRLGLGATYSTTYHEPFHVARLFSTMDHLLGGRVAWNVVTSLNDSEAANFGQEAHLGHDRRYDRADEFMEVVLGHWDSWEDAALRQDREDGVFADPARVRRLEHRGEWFRSRGPFTLPRTPQGRPVIIQAGQSGRGRRFAARWGELVFVIQPNLAGAQAEYRAIKQAVAEVGRDPAAVRVLPAAYCVLGETRAMAEEKAAYVESLARPIDALALLSEALNFDFARVGLDQPLGEADLAAMGGLQTLRDRVVAHVAPRAPTPRDFITLSKRGTVREFAYFVGTATDVADEMEAWFRGEGCDGFVLAATHMPGSYEDMARLLVPELQRRGLFQREYAGETLRENLGLGRAERDDWERSEEREVRSE